MLGSSGYSQAWLRGDGPYGHVHEGIRLEAGDGWVGVGDRIEEDKPKDKKTQMMVRRVDNEGAKVWTYIVGDSHTTKGKTAYSAGYSVIQVRKPSVMFAEWFTFYVPSPVTCCMWAVGSGRNRAKS